MVYGRSLRYLRLLQGRFARMWRAGGYSHLDESELKRRAAHLSARLPMLYLIFVATALLIIAVFAGTASIIKTALIPSIYIAICLMRARHWSRKSVLARDTKKLRKDINRLQFVGPAIIVFAIIWIVSLYPEADPFQRGVIHYVIAVMITSGILTLIDTPRTAILGGLAAVAPFCIALIYYGDFSHALIAICQFIITGLLMSIAVQYYEDLGQLLSSSRQLRERQAAIEKNAAELEILSSTDPLTAILNRRAILAAATEQIADTTKPGPWLALLDLDGFKQTNDSYGHLVGDEVLKMVAQRIVEEPGVCQAGRIGGDEFAFLIKGEASEEEAVAIAERLARSIAHPMEINGIQLKQRTSIGLRKTARMTLGDCLERADFALFKAKGSAKSVALFDAEQEQELLFNNRVAADFKSADLNHEIEIAFQPIIDFDAKHVLAVEALARWKRRSSSVVMPNIFIELAESTGRMSEITDCMISKSLLMASEWPKQVGIQINLSPQDLLRQELPNHIQDSLKAAKIPASRVTFEVTETTIMVSEKKALLTIQAIRALGCRIALDDFGTGYSSLAYIDRFPFDQIKLDREFARKIAEGETSAAVASTVFALSQKLGLECTIEGIETEEQALFARTLGMRRMQGFYFSRPLCQDALIEMLEKPDEKNLDAAAKDIRAA